jgi:GntR family transcriptional regulator, rspAB operon transcriptional repressor
MSAERTMIKMMKENLPKESEVERVFRLIKGWILDCEIRPGDYVSELQLARLCKSSRTPVREACNRLSEGNWIRRIPRRGYLVPPISARDIVEIYEFRALLEGFAAERAARLAGREELEALEALAARERDPKKPLRELLALNEDFHLAVAKIARNQRIVAQVGEVLEYVRRLDLLSIEKDHAAVTHEEILAALVARAPARAKRAMVVHVECSRDRMLKIFGS